MTIHNNTITGYKVFEPDFTCRDYDFQGVGTTHTYEGLLYFVNPDSTFAPPYKIALSTIISPAV